MNNEELRIAIEKFQIWLRRLESINSISRKHDLAKCSCYDCEFFQKINSTLNSLYEIQDFLYRHSAEGTR